MRLLTWGVETNSRDCSKKSTFWLNSSITALKVINLRELISGIRSLKRKKKKYLKSQKRSIRFWLLCYKTSNKGTKILLKFDYFCLCKSSYPMLLAIQLKTWKTHIKHPWSLIFMIDLLKFIFWNRFFEIFVEFRHYFLRMNGIKPVSFSS